MTTNQILVAARALIEKPRTWCKGASARAKDGSIVEYDSKSAISHCSFGALQVAGPNGEAIAFCQRQLELATGDSLTLIDWNDESTRTHAEVLAAFDRAIEATKEQP